MASGHAPSPVTHCQTSFRPAPEHASLPGGARRGHQLGREAGGAVTPGGDGREAERAPL
jgi:hypothetical protein